MKASEPKKAYRYPGLWAFQSEQANIFYGRDKEKEELFYMSLSSQVVLLFARSGIGKSSLLNAGVIPMLKDGGFQPITVKFTKIRDVGNAAIATPLELLKSALCPFESNRNILFDADKPQLWEFFKTCSFTAPSGPVIIFDQFEELFSYPPEEIEEFLLNLSELVHEKAPSRIIRWLLKIDTASRTRDEIAWVNQPRVKFIFAIRSDRLADLQRMDKIIPGVFSNRYELMPMDAANAAQAIKRPAEDPAPDYFESEQFNYDAISLEKIIRNLKSEHKGEIEPTQLQIVCRYIEDMVKNSYSDTSKKPVKVITSEVFDADTEIDNVLHNYYEQQLVQVGNSHDQTICRQLLENDLLEKNQGTYSRVRLSEGRVMDRLESKEYLLKKLLDTRLIKGETEDNITYYQITHDSLKDPILESKKISDERDRIENHRITQLTEAKKCIDEHYEYRKNNNPEMAIECLKQAENIYESVKDEQGRIDARIKYSKVLMHMGHAQLALNVLQDTQSQISSNGDKKLLGLIKEDIGIIFSILGDKKTAEKTFRESLADYEEVNDYSLIARMAEHLGDLTEERIRQEPGKQEKLLHRGIYYYDKASKAFSLINDTFGYERVNRCITRVKTTVNEIRTAAAISEPWGYMTELFTGKVHPMKGQNNIRIGRDTNDPVSPIKNEIGFSGKYRVMSRRHVSISPDRTIEDTQSLNGTTINNIPLYYGNPRVLADGDIVVLANIMPLKFTVTTPDILEVPKKFWGLFIEGSLKKFQYLAIEKPLYSLHMQQKPGIGSSPEYDFLFREGDSEDALIHFRFNNNQADFFVEDKIVATTSKDHDGNVKDILAVWKILTTIKDTNRFYKDYFINTEAWLAALDFPMQPQLIDPADKEDEQDTVLYYGPTFQLIISPEYNQDVVE